MAMVRRGDGGRVIKDIIVVVIISVRLLKSASPERNVTDAPQGLTTVWGTFDRTMQHNANV